MKCQFKIILLKNEYKLQKHIVRFVHKETWKMSANFNYPLHTLKKNKEYTNVHNMII